MTLKFDYKHESYGSSLITFSLLIAFQNLSSFPFEPFILAKTYPNDYQKYQYQYDDYDSTHTHVSVSWIVLLNHFKSYIFDHLTGLYLVVL